MNIKDITQGNSPSSSECKLHSIFEAQKKLMEKYKPIEEKHYSEVFGIKIKMEDADWNGGEHNAHTRVGNFLIKEMIDATIHELSEAVQTMKNWKPWKSTPVPTDYNHLKEEMADALHFYIEACIRLGITANELHDLYHKKNAVNKFRQDSHY